MHVINQIVKGNLYFRFKTKRMIAISVQVSTTKINLLYEIRFQKFVDVDFSN